MFIKNNGLSHYVSSTLNQPATVKEKQYGKVRLFKLLTGGRIIKCTNIRDGINQARQVA